MTYAVTATVVSTASHREHFSLPEGWIRYQQTGRQGGGGNEARQKMSSNLLRVALGNRMAPWATGRAEEQTVDDVQPGKIAGTMGEVASEWHQVQVEAVQGPAGVGRSLAISMAWQTMIRVATALGKLGKNCRICRSRLLVPLLAKHEEFKFALRHPPTLILCENDDKVLTPRPTCTHRSFPPCVCLRLAPQPGGLLTDAPPWLELSWVW
jgi:hypothetical protein